MNNASDLGFFVIVAKSPTLARAAQELGVTPSSVSKRLQALERRLGVRLMNRNTRRISLTQEGEVYVSQGSQLLDELITLEHAIAGGQAIPQGLLRVHATLGFGRRHIVPVLSRFSETYPKVEVQLQLSDRPVNLVEEGFDVAIRFGDMPDSRLTSRLLANNRRLLLASPAYLKSHGIPRKPQDLQHHDCIVLRESNDTYGNWHLSNGSRTETVKVRGRLSTNDGESALAWSLDGRGIVTRSEWDAAHYVREGRLVVVLEGWQLPAANISAVYPTRKNLSARTRALVNALVDWFEPQRSQTSDALSFW